MNTDSNGSLLLEISLNNNFYIVNTDTLSHFGESNQSPANLDLTFATADILQELTYNQIDDTWGSDHYPINKYMHFLADHMDNYDQSQYKVLSSVKKYKYISNLMKEAVCYATPGRQWDVDSCSVNSKQKEQTWADLKNKRSTPKSWWDQECEDSIKNRNNWLKKFKKTKNLDDYINFKKAKAIARRTINLKKKQILSILLMA
ncbi:hypothetical protein PUN28_004257 [Cardiocondyla obscurior]|uniref:Endonuclease/exonuclease/phosphatase domain-containing protein n=1 Tax=Cardiocondyla obscurior TaxID=286306 RepID=A0AAW2G9U4_9HYME